MNGRMTLKVYLAIGKPGAHPAGQTSMSVEVPGLRDPLMFFVKFII